jgi:hypothetical protein
MWTIDACARAPALMCAWVGFFSACHCHYAFAQTSHSFPLYCQGPLSTVSLPAPNSTTSWTAFKWSSKGASIESEGPGECAWKDRGPRGSEIKDGYGNVICDSSGIVKSLPAGHYLAISVYRDESSDNCMRVTGLLSTIVPSPARAILPQPSQFGGGQSPGGAGSESSVPSGQDPGRK